MIVDNFDNFLTNFGFEDGDNDHFYVVNIMQRRKENPNLKKDTHVVKTYCFYSKEEFLENKNRITSLCVEYNARAYVCPNRRSSKRIAHNMLSELADALLNENYRSARTLFDSCCGKYADEKDKVWIVDVDKNFYENTLLVEEMRQRLEGFKYKKDVDCVKAIMPTKNGFHILARPFDQKEFKKVFGEIDIHKDNYTLLYYEN